ncbi:hypothetical protein Glove_26g269 [Diversispora epigaea]|uniref:Uncharacterized protein n=1 Tax=Diversispora epigaea TaxID=1348612 RepID=A0A397JUE2_9GLOM|nr:hypothetical protein Glove_26g269 [Diversispora epigaea]
MSYFIPSPLSNRTSVPSLQTSQFTFKTSLNSNNYAVSNTRSSKKSKVSIQKEINITNLKENNTEKFEEDNYPKVNVTRYKEKRAYYYQYNILDLGSYPTNVRRTQRSRYRIPNGYWVQVYIYERDVKITNTKGSTLSDIILFGLDLTCLELRRENKENLVSEINSRKKPFSNLKSNSQKNKRLKNLASDIYSNSKSLFNSHNFSNISLDSLRFNIQDQFIKINFSNFNNELKSDIYLDSILCACDESLISRDGYRQLAAVQLSLEREYQNNLNTFLDENEEVFINSDQIGNGSVRSLIGLLITLISDLTEGNNPILQNNDIIKIKLSGDGRQIGRICLYPGTENHELLTIAHKQIIEELTILYNNGFKDNNNIHWKVEFWFTADWKYMALILEINGPTLNYFCLWCECHKNERWDINKNC